MKQLVEKILARWGSELVLVSGAERVRVRALLQHTASKSRQNMLPGYGALGKNPGGQYVYIGPGSVPVREGMTLLSEQSYLLRRAEPVHFRGNVLYYWGLCERKGGEQG